ncbi:hypothetical protein EVAR_22578_1 [Eumeta japonica]|uniref:Uncharacterized protein n=1 Tax=Eumeta variegata TaxID=151549 RepID=A0A4C1U7E4_EUMVA|nr:hypothetical protein EVAR_22578_1 [Eumeta japonica]
MEIVTSDKCRSDVSKQRHRTGRRKCERAAAGSGASTARRFVLCTRQCRTTAYRLATVAAVPVRPVLYHEYRPTHAAGQRRHISTVTVIVVVQFS